MLNEEVAKYRELSGDTNPNTPISRIGGYLDGYEKALEQEPSDDAISRQAVLNKIKKVCFSREQEWVDFRVSQGSNGQRDLIINFIEDLPPVTPQPKIGHCKDCKYFEYDSVAKVDGIPLIVAHEICKRWGDGCKTKEDGYCFMFEPQERSGEG